MTNLTRRSSLLGFLGITSALLGILISVQVVSAHEFSPKFRWYSSSVTVKDTTSSYLNQIDTAVFEYHNYTEMNWSESDLGDMVFKEMDFGTTGWYAGAVSERLVNQGWVGCMTYPGLAITGECNAKDAKAHKATIYLNTQYKTDLDLEIDNVVLHEPGHAIGMAHTECTETSVMKPSGCGNSYIILKPHDKLHINSWY